MKVLGRILVPPFDAFWEQFGAEVLIPVEYVEEGHSSVFGDQGMDLSATNLPGWTSLPDDDLSYHVAHELTHIVMKERGFPRSGRGPQYPEDSAEARVGGYLEELVLHPALETLIDHFGFKKGVLQTRMFEGAINGLARGTVPDRGTPWFFTWAMRYCELHLELAAHQWQHLQAIYRTRSSEVCELGEELVAIMAEVGCGTSEQALDAMVRVRDTLGLKVDERVLVIDPISGRVL